MNFMAKNRRLKQPLHLTGYQTNPQGKQTPVFTTKEISYSTSLPGARKKKSK